MLTIILSLVVVISSIIGWCSISKCLRQWMEASIERKLNEEDNSSPRANHEEAIEQASYITGLIDLVVIGLGLPILAVTLDMCL